MHYLGAVKREDLEDCGLRVELNARHLLLVLLAQQQQKFEAAEANLPDIETANTRVARMYRKGVHEAILSTIEELVSSVQKLCALGCDLVANDSHALPKYIMAGGMPCNTASSETDTEDSSRSKRARVESSLEQFLSTVLITEAAFESDSEFALAAAQVDVDEDTLLALFVIRLLHNPSSAWHAAIKRLEDFKHPMLVAGQSEEYAEMLMELYEIHEALFPVLSETFPEVFPAEQFSLDGFLWAAGVVSALDVRVVVRSDGAAAGGLCVV
ncbi:hypothetical protein FBU59_003212 [Linderina macrospora]|uniref:Uncharacterized protein n=1 Tax=Linderina macrospora TaxID=4868 RepID=A0ACC1J9A4_9FUNG|nr:hypothetical protein FBU59_003212 [Linderina macrospora]